VGRTLADAFDPEEIDAQFEWLRVAPITREAAWETAAIEARLRRDDAPNRDRIDALAGDAVVAGAAAVLDATVVTENVDDFLTLGVSAEPYG
jgi:predicted nucleic acid-binding protein